MLYIGFFYNNQ